jgi:hypothetical protein
LPTGGLAGYGRGKKEEQATLATEVGPTIKLNSLVVNLNEANCRHYIRTTIVLELA